MNEKVQKALQTILERFKSGDIPEAIAFSLFPIQEIPSAKWSLMNRLLMFMAHTRDARGIRQWNRIGRKVKKGSKAIYILVPLLVQEKDEKTGEEVRILRGFMGRPVFRVEDTEGQPLSYGSDAPLPEFPLMERAREWNIQVSGYDGPPGFYGVYSPERKEISLATPEEKVFSMNSPTQRMKRLSGNSKAASFGRRRSWPNYPPRPFASWLENGLPIPWGTLSGISIGTPRQRDFPPLPPV